MSSQTCRRCSECLDREHHWLHGEGGFDEETGAPFADYGCKHCDAVGNECEACCDGETVEGFECEECIGAAVIELEIFERCESCRRPHPVEDEEVWPHDEDGIPLCPRCAREMAAEENAS